MFPHEWKPMGHVPFQFSMYPSVMLWAVSITLLFYPENMTFQHVTHQISSKYALNRRDANDVLNHFCSLSKFKL